MDVDLGTQDGSPLCIPIDNGNGELITNLEDNYKTNFVEDHNKSENSLTNYQLKLDYNTTNDRIDIKEEEDNSEEEKSSLCDVNKEDNDNYSCYSDQYELYTQSVKKEEVDNTYKSGEDTRTNPMSIASDDGSSINHYSLNEGKDITNYNYITGDYISESYKKNIEVMSNDKKSSLFIGDIDAYRINTDSNEEDRSMDYESCRGLGRQMSSMTK